MRVKLRFKYRNSMLGKIIDLFRNCADYLIDTSPSFGYTFGMKTAISIPDSVFRAAEKYAKRMQKSRSQLFSEAMVEYLQRHTPDEITRKMNETIESIGDFDNSFVRKASQNLLGHSKW